MKYLIVLVVVMVAVMLWRSNRRAERQERDAAGSPPPRGTSTPQNKQAQDNKPQDMVRCPVCAVHLPRSDALPGADGQLYCSNAHRLRAPG